MLISLLKLNEKFIIHKKWGGGGGEAAVTILCSWEIPFHLLFIPFHLLFETGRTSQGGSAGVLGAAPLPHPSRTLMSTNPAATPPVGHGSTVPQHYERIGMPLSSKGDVQWNNVRAPTVRGANFTHLSPTKRLQVKPQPLFVNWHRQTVTQALSSRRAVQCKQTREAPAKTTIVVAIGTGKIQYSIKTFSQSTCTQYWNQCSDWMERFQLQLTT